MPLTPQFIVRAYAAGYFPMAAGRWGEIDWYSPDPRAVLPLSPPEAFHVSHSLRQGLRRGGLAVTFDRAFGQVIRACAQPRPYAADTWINDQIIDAYTQLHRMGLAHSVEAWSVERRALSVEREEGSVERSALTVERDALRVESEAPLVERHDAATPDSPRSTLHAPRSTLNAPRLLGGLYGVSLGGAFFGESMFTRATDASKVCLVHLVEHLRQRGYQLLDCQIANAHMQQFGIVDIPRAQYLRQLEAALALAVKWSG